MHWHQAAVHLALALVLGASISAERQWRQHISPLRSNAPVAAGAAMFVMLRKGMNEGRKTLEGLRWSSAPLTSLEKALSGFRQELTPGDAARLRIFAAGRVRELDSSVQDPLFLVIREALTNALRHSEAANIEAEIEYLARRLRAAVRDNGIGINPELLHDDQSHVGLTAMRERAERIGAQLRLWSKSKAGTEIEISLPV